MEYMCSIHTEYRIYAENAPARIKKACMHVRKDVEHINIKIHFKGLQAVYKL